MPKGVYLHKREPEIARFNRYISIVDNGCWVWIGSRNNKEENKFLKPENCSQKMKFRRTFI